MPPPPNLISNVVHANEVESHTPDVLVEPESNEDFLYYLELTDNFTITTAERIPTDGWDTPAKVKVITAAEIEANHYQSVAEALSHVNGVMVTSLGRRDSSGFVSINGTGRVLLLIDGHRANNAQGISAGYKGDISELSIIPSMKMVERIEIVKGASSALYGSDAVGGVVNIITKKGERDETEIDVNFGSWSRQNYDVTNQGVIGNIGWFVTAGFGKSDIAKHPGNNTNAYEYNDYKDRDVAIRVDDQFDDRRSLTASYSHRSHDYTDELFYTIHNNASLEYRFKENTSTPGWIRVFNNYLKGNPPATGTLFSTARLFGAEYQNGWEFSDRHKFIAGVEYHKIEEECSEFNIDDDLTNTAAYLQDTFDLTDKWTLIPGVRYDKSSEFNGNWSPKLAVNYRADDRTKIYASVGRSYRVPTIGELYMDYTYSDGSKQFGAMVSASSLYVASGKPEKGHGETIGIEHKLTDRSSIDFNIFNNQVDNALYWIYDGHYSYDTYSGTITELEDIYTLNEIKEKRRGSEINYSQQLSDQFGFDVGYSHIHLQNDNLNPSSYAGMTRKLYYSQPNGYRLNAHYQNGRWKANLLGIMATGRNAIYGSSNYLVLDFNTSYAITDRASVYLRALNFTDEEYTNDFYDIDNLYKTNAPGRFFQIGATYTF